MLQRRKYFYKKQIIFSNFFLQLLQQKIRRSFLENHFLIPKVRLQFLQTRISPHAPKYYFRSMDSLVCSWNFSRRVPSRKLLLSRFTLGRHFNSLTLGPFQK